MAILIGFGVGLLITFGIYYANKSLKESRQIKSPIADIEQTTPTPSAEISSTLTLVSPLDESISKENKVSVSGATSPGAWVLLLTETGEKVLQANDKGEFETEVFLISGENEIQVQSLNDKGESVSKTVTVVYSTAEI